MSQQDQNLVVALKQGDNVLDLIPVINETHGMNLDPALYEERVVYATQFHTLKGDLVNKTTGLVEWVITNVSKSYKETFTVKHPKQLVHENIPRYSSIFINTERELEFLSHVSVGIPYEGGFTGNNAARYLMELLNLYQIGTGWSCLPHRGNTTAGFTLLYFGIPETIPREFVIHPNAKFVAIVELETYTGKAVFSLTVGNT